MIARYYNASQDHATYATYKGHTYRGIGDTPNSADDACLDSIRMVWSLTGHATLQQAMHEANPAAAIVELPIVKLGAAQFLSLPSV